MKPIGFSRNQTKSRVFSFTKDWLDAIPLYDIDFTKYKVVPIEGHWDMTAAACDYLLPQDVQTVGDVGKLIEIAIAAAPEIEDL